MLILVFLLLFFILVLIEDFKYREISSLYLGFIFFLSLYYGRVYIKISWYEYLINLLIILFVVFLLVLFYSVKAGEVTNILDSQIGVGDLLMYVILASLFPTLYFLIFLTISHILTLIFHLIYVYVFKRIITVPLAGYLAGFACVYLLLCNIDGGII